MAGSGTGGVATAVAEVLAAQEGLPSDPAREADQPDLWAEAEGEGAGPLDDMARLGDALFGKPRRGAGGGRPKGSQNRQTVEFRKLLLSKHRHPVLVLADFYSVPVEELAKRLRTDDLLAVAKFQKECAATAAMYVEKRQPIDIAVKQERGLTLVIGDLAGAAQQGATIDGAATEVEQYQGLNLTLAMVDGTRSMVGAEKAEQDQWVTDGGGQIMPLPVADDHDMIAHDASRNPPPDRDPGGPPPGDDPTA